MREDEGAWQPSSTECAGDDTYDAEPGHTYTFRLSASDNVGNANSLEVQAVVPYVTKYYYANGQRVAMRQGDVVYYIHADHLGSTSLLSDQAGNQVPGSAVRYLPYGGFRVGDAGTLPMDYGFASQRLDAGIGLYQMGARWYDARIGRWIQPDIIVPKPTKPQEFNRYAYCLGNPLRYLDPTGHQQSVNILTGEVESFGETPGWGTLAVDLTVAPIAIANPIVTATPAVQPREEYYWAPAPPGLFGSPALAPTPTTEEIVAVGILLGLELITTLGAVAVPPTGMGNEMHMPPGQAGLTTGPLSTGNLLPAPPAPAGLLPGAKENPWAAPPVSFVLEKETTAWRVWGGTSGETGGFMMLTKPPDRATARMLWALQPGNTAENLTEFRIPAGTRMQIGWAKDNFDQPGGALQFQVLDRVQPSWIVNRWEWK